MKKFLFPVAVVALPFLSSAADVVTVKAVNSLPLSRPNQVIEVTGQQLAALGDLNKLHVKDASGKDVVAQAVDTDWDDYHKPDLLIFQSDFAPGETKTFTVTAGKAQEYKPSDYKAYGRFVRERFDDYAWENDLIAHRTYGKALETWKGEPLTSSSIDIWSKLNPALVINEWYMMGDAYYHHLNSNGADLYSAGSSRGNGGTGIWAGDKLFVAKNFVESRTLAGGPIRVMFELDYPAYDVNGAPVTETRRISLDAGSQLDHYQVTFHAAANAGSPAIGLKKVNGEQKEFDAAHGTLVSWQSVEKNNGMQGVAVIVVDEKSVDREAEDKANNLVLLKAGALNGQPVSYWAGFAWDKAGKITTAEAWKKYVDEFAQKVRSPIEVTVSAQ
ncbi:MAG TPA: DUF4861 family protein [Desulfuromonadaceae bacterium]|nr:DUF4861 family protein [Desulfuromonadaceae bacterium]